VRPPIKSSDSLTAPLPPKQLVSPKPHDLILPKSLATDIVAQADPNKVTSLDTTILPKPDPLVQKLVNVTESLAPSLNPIVE